MTRTHVVRGLLAVAAGFALARMFLAWQEPRILIALLHGLPLCG